MRFYIWISGLNGALVVQATSLEEAKQKMVDDGIKRYVIDKKKKLSVGNIRQPDQDFSMLEYIKYLRNT